jgi:hypothetical protein
VPLAVVDLTVAPLEHPASLPHSSPELPLVVGTVGKVLVAKSFLQVVDKLPFIYFAGVVEDDSLAFFLAFGRNFSEVNPVLVFLDMEVGT